MTAAHVSQHEWCTARGMLSLDEPVVFGILNTTPDSFYDGGLHAGVETAVSHACDMIGEGAHGIDIGGESTRPGAVAISSVEEIGRIIPVIQSLLARVPNAIISVDTSKAEVAQRALDAGAAIINDVSAFRIDPALAAVVARAHAGVVLMHSRGGVHDMASYTHASYEDVVEDVTAELCDVVGRARAAGIADDAIVLDPGLGFSKRTEHSIALLAHLDRITALGFPVLVGPSRKRFVGDVAGGLPVEQRLEGTVAACCVALLHGACIFRVHDVAAVRRGLAVADAVLRASNNAASSEVRA